MGGLAVTAAYQSWGIYKIYHPSSNFKGGLERLHAEAAKHPDVKTDLASSLPKGEFPVPDGIFRVRHDLPFNDLLTYVNTTHADILYLNFKDFPLEKGNLYKYILQKVDFPYEKADVTDEEGEENLGSLLRYLSLRMVEKMTEHRPTHIKSNFSPQAWLEFFFRRFGVSSSMESFYTARFPLIIVEGCDVWEDIWTAASKETTENEERRQQLEEILNFLKWLFVFRYHTHVVLLAEKPIDQILAVFSHWYEEEAAPKPVAPRKPELVIPGHRYVSVCCIFTRLKECGCWWALDYKWVAYGRCCRSDGSPSECVCEMGSAGRLAWAAAWKTRGRNEEVRDRSQELYSESLSPQLPPVHRTNTPRQSSGTSLQLPPSLAAALSRLPSFAPLLDTLPAFSRASHTPSAAPIDPLSAVNPLYRPFGRFYRTYL